MWYFTRYFDPEARSQNTPISFIVVYLAAFYPEHDTPLKQRCLRLLCSIFRYVVVLAVFLSRNLPPHQRRLLSSLSFCFGNLRGILSRTQSPRSCFVSYAFPEDVLAVNRAQFISRTILSRTPHPWRFLHSADISRSLLNFEFCHW